jgi:hypothetical protein
VVADYAPQFRSIATWERSGGLAHDQLAVKDDALRNR